MITFEQLAAATMCKELYLIGPYYKPAVFDKFVPPKKFVDMEVLTVIILIQSKGLPTTSLKNSGYTDSVISAMALLEGVGVRNWRDVAAAVASNRIARTVTTMLLDFVMRDNTIGPGYSPEDLRIAKYILTEAKSK